ncbi:porin [Desulfurivibrio alkaliphilus]|nr:porin [Desulfurivibrio alkaliphilus]
MAIIASNPAQALTLHDQDGTKIDLYSRLYLFYENTSDGRIAGDGSRLGLRASHQVDDSLSVFARAEFRYDASQRERDQVFNDRRNTYVGVKHSALGQLMVGNFDSIYLQSVSHLFDIYEQEGFVAMGQGGTASRANSVAYSSPVFSGLQLHGQVRHYEESESVSGDEELVFQLAGTYHIGDLTLGLGSLFSNEDAAAAFTETLIGASASYQVMKDLSLRLMVEHLKDAGDDDYHYAIGGIYNYGQGDLYATAGRDWNEDSYFALGANYKFSRPMRVFIEYGNGDAIDPDNVLTVGFRYDF